MATTRANAEVVLVGRTRKKMVVIGFDVTTVGTNPDLDDPMFTALVNMGKTPVGATVADADLAAFSTPEYVEFLDRAELRLLESLYQNINFNDIQVGPRKVSLNQLADQIAKAIGMLQSKVDDKYNDSVPALGKGIIRLSTQAKRSC